ncbi:MAG TPA: IS481 family transposase [Gemmatimonadales bacterium]|nr:IS481 family transposase [Gemmatimonadales bacterium]
MTSHPKAKLGLAGRLALVREIESGRSQRAAAAAFCVSPATAHKWWRRWLEAGEAGRGSGACLMDRSSRPRRSPNQTPSEVEQRICEKRRQTGWGPRPIAIALGVPHSTVWKVLWRHGLSRPEKAPKEAVVRYEWPFCGDLLHMDVAKYPRFARAGHAVTGDRRKTGREKRAPLGHDYAHVIVDDHSRLAYAELLDDERAPTVTGFVQRALRWFAGRGITSRRLMTDGAFAYTHNRSLRELLAHHGIRHLVTEPYRPATNGKVERFHQTMTREWAKGRRYDTSHQRNTALPSWLHAYNHHRPHGGIDGHPPITRVHDLPEHNN